MKILVLGKNGQVAWELQRSLAVLGEVRSVGQDEANFVDPSKLVEIIRSYKPSHIVNAAAYTAVDKAETEENIATIVNGNTVGVIAEEAKKLGSLLFHYSTDYVFNGKKESPYVEDDSTDPLNAYGRSKLLGEKLITEVGGDHIILRVSWVYGNRGTNFYKTMLSLGAQKEMLRIVNDQIGAPTWSRHIADATAHILKDARVREKSGIYHLSPKGETSWFGFAEKIFEKYKSIYPESSLKIKDLQGISTQEYGARAPRPLNSRMSSEKLRKTFCLELPSWDSSLDLVVRTTNC